jgi:hypothetical protein
MLRSARFAQYFDSLDSLGRSLGRVQIIIIYKTGVKRNKIQRYDDDSSCHSHCYVFIVYVYVYVLLLTPPPSTIHHLPSTSTMAAAATDPTGTSSIEALFSSARPSIRFRDSRRNRRGRMLGNITELELLPGLTVGNVEAAGITWEGLCRFARDSDSDRFLWMTPGGFVFSRCIEYPLYPVAVELGSNSGTLMYVHATTAGAAATCDFMVRLLATSDSDHLFIREGYTLNGDPSPSISGAGLSIFFRESRSCLRKVKL